ncbi:zinc ribbon domain-containing protein [Clostridium perfringens]|nr:zinc ribbon domain-containing protein [Clostridium perfringens]
MNRQLKFEKGDKCIVAIESGSNASRGKRLALDNVEDWTKEVEIVSATKKYVKTKGKDGYVQTFVVDDNYREKYKYGGADHKLYKSLEELKNEIESKELVSKFSFLFDRFSIPKLSIDKLRRINEIIENNEEKKTDIIDKLINEYNLTPEQIQQTYDRYVWHCNYYEELRKRNEEKQVVSGEKVSQACPNCGYAVNWNFCPNCGQKLKW